MTSRSSKVSRETGETKVSVELNVDGTGVYKLNTGNGMLDHLLAQLSRHGLMDLTVEARGDVQTGWHHLAEDVGIALGRAFREAAGDGRGITRTAHSYVPLDEALALTVVDFGGRGFGVVDAPMSDADLAGLTGDLLGHLLETLAREGGFNLHVRVLAGHNGHHVAEAVFKSLARSIRAALTPDERRGGDVPSTKGTIG